MRIAVDLNASFVVHAGSCVWRLLSSSVAMRRREEGEGVRSPRLFFRGCGAPRVTALSWAPCPIEGGMAGNFVAASWMDEGPLARVAGVVGARSVCVVWWPRGFAISRWLWE
ncbi:surface protease GP63 [Trypanosoma cruzi]|nr:surface protease GP63 [Trypanosoma cruzi]